MDFTANVRVNPMRSDQSPYPKHEKPSSASDPQKNRGGVWTFARRQDGHSTV
jgi:hypothetical protein